MVNDYTYRISFDRLIAVEELLATHYGLGVVYFARHGERGEDYVELEFPCSYEDFLSCFKSEREFINTNGKKILKKIDLPNTPENALIIDAIWLMTIICSRIDWDEEMPDEYIDYSNSLFSKEDFDSHDELEEFLSFNWNEWLDQFYNAKARKDLLELYIYHIKKPKQRDLPTQLTIKYGTGKSLKLENKDNWFERVLLHNHFKKYLPDIKSEEDAIKALNILNHPGRKLQRPLMYHFIYGTYSMVSEHLGKESVSESFCDLLIKLMEQMDYPTEYVYKGKTREMDNQYIRKMISKLKNDADKYRFNLEAWLSLEESKSALRMSGRFLYSLMG
jgi:hypothetical protein